MYSRLTSTNSDFFARHLVFRAEEFFDSRKQIQHDSKNSSLSYHSANGKLIHIRRGLYAVVPETIDADIYIVDPFLVAAKATDDAVIAYRTALSLHGYSYTLHDELFYLTAKKETSKFEFQRNEYKGITQPKALLRRKKEFYEVESTDRLGVNIKITSLERTFVDCFDRIELSGGIEEVWRSLESITYLNLDRITKYLSLLDNAVTTAKVGYFLDVHKEQLNISDKQLRPLLDRKPKNPTYMFRSDRHGKLIRDWNLIVPEFIIERSWEELQ